MARWAVVVSGVVSGAEARGRGKITCGCGASWTALGAAHCSGCHALFASVGLFDAHRSREGEHGTCLDPETLTTKAGERRLLFRDGMWRGPEMSAERLEQLGRVAS